MPDPTLHGAAPATLARDRGSERKPCAGASVTILPWAEWDHVWAALPECPLANRGDRGALHRYGAALADFPGPKSGRTHAELLRVANLGRLGGLTPEAVAADLHAVRPDKPHREIAEAVSKAYAGDWTPAPFTPSRTAKPAPVAACEAMKARAQKTWPEEYDPIEALWQSSPTRVHWDPSEDAAYVLRELYDPSDLLFIGRRYDHAIPGRTLRTAAAWLEHIARGGRLGPHWCMNPLTGLEADGGTTRRGDGCVAAFRFTVFECDGPSQAEQAALLLTARLPLAAVIDSGGGSLHAWLRVDCADVEAWTRDVENDLFPRLLVPLGGDRACRNEARLSRTPGHLRADTGRVQRLLWLANGGAAS